MLAGFRPSAAESPAGDMRPEDKREVKEEAECEEEEKGAIF